MLSKELKAIHKMQELLKSFDNTARQRMLEYTSKMFWSEENKRVEEASLKKTTQTILHRDFATDTSFGTDTLTFGPPSKTSE